MKRRAFVKAAASTVVGAAASTALTVPRAVLAAHPRAVDLVVSTIQWSDDNGLTWGTEPVRKDAAVLFRATVRNAGLAAAPINRPVQVDFRFGNEVVTIADSHRSGLAAGAEVVVTANTSPMGGDPFWHATELGPQTITAEVDSPDFFPAENSEDNNSASRTVTAEISVATALGIVGQVIGGAFGPFGVPVGGSIGHLIGVQWDNYEGQLGPSTPIHADEQSGGAHGAFPMSASQAALTFGTSIGLLNRAIGHPEIGFAAKGTKAWYKLAEPKIFGSDGAIEDLGEDRRSIRSYIMLHAQQMKDEGNTEDLRNLMLYHDFFFDKNGNAITNGGRASALGCTEPAFYGAVCKAANNLPSTGISYERIRALCILAGFRGYRVPGWGDPSFMNHASLLHLPLLLRPTETNGLGGANGLRQSYDAGSGLVSNVGVHFNTWTEHAIARAKATNVVFPAFFLVTLRIILILLAKGYRGQATQNEAVNWAKQNGWKWSAGIIAQEVLNVVTGKLAPALREGIAEEMLSRIQQGQGGPARNVAMQAFLLNAASNPRQITHYQDTIKAYTAWLQGRVRVGVSVRSGRIVFS